MSTPAQDAGPRHAEIDRRIRAMTWCVWVLVVVAALILLCCIITWITMSIDLKKDRSVEVAPPEPTPPPGDGDGDGEPPPPTICDDKNDCTVDFERVAGGCEYRRKKTNTLCDTVCFDATIGGPLRCQLVEVQKGVSIPKCMGTRTQCRGFCQTAGDCPSDLFLDLMPEIDPIPIEPQCVGGTCIYEYQPFVQVPGQGRPPFDTCFNQSSEIQETWCDSVLRSFGEEDFRDCLTTEYRCNEDNLPICVKYFWCSIPCIGVESGGAARWLNETPQVRKSISPGPGVILLKRGPHGEMLALPKRGPPPQAVPVANRGLPPGIRLPPKTM